MKRFLLALAFSVLLVSPALAKEDITGWVKGQAGIDWNATPRDYPAAITSKDRIFWIGVIEEVAAYINDQKEMVIEFLCNHLTLVQPNPQGLQEPIKAKATKTGYFVITLRSPSLTLEQAKGFKEGIRKDTHYAAVLGEPVDIRDFSGRQAVYVHSQKAEMSAKLKIQILN